MSRGKARELLFKLVYAFLQNPEVELSVFLKDHNENQLIDVESRKYIENVFAIITGNTDNLSDRIGEKDVYVCDRAILLVAVAEILHFPDVPNAVAISEAIQLAKKYSTEKSAKFINGVLAKVVKDSGV